MISKIMMMGGLEKISFHKAFLLKIDEVLFSTQKQSKNVVKVDN